MCMRVGVPKVSIKRYQVSVKDCVLFEGDEKGRI